MKIAILGYGTIGSGVDKIISSQTNQTKTLTVTRLLTRPADVAVDPRATSDIAELLADPDLDAVVETMGGIEPAHTYIMQALNAGLHVVTANKAVVARYLREFSEAAAANQVHFYYEATTGGGIPWLKNLENAARVDDVSSVSGIFNGTSNYILDQMSKTGADFEDALAQAQALATPKKIPPPMLMASMWPINYGFLVRLPITPHLISPCRPSAFAMSLRPTLNGLMTMT